MYAAQVAARRRMPSWNIVPHHVQERVLDHVSIADLHNLRLAGFGGRDVAWTERLRSLFFERRTKLQELKRASTAHERLRIMQLPGAAALSNPEQFSALEKMTLHVGETMGGAEEPLEVPEGIGEMHRLSSLTIGSAGPLRSLPDSLSRCTALRVLTLSGLAFEVLPPVILKLARLRILNLSRCGSLGALPEDIGESLQNLSKVDIRDCEKLQAIPESLLKRLEISKMKVPLLLRLTCFEAGYVDSLLDETKYPRLRVLIVGT
jgi:Leucine-rich repeat (LRR) protein